MKKNEDDLIHEIVTSLLLDLLDLPEGSRITLNGLIADSLYAEHQLSEDIWETIQKRLKSLADRIYIDLVRQDDGSFIVHNLNAQIVCPYCGSTNTIRNLDIYNWLKPLVLEKLNQWKIHFHGVDGRSHDDRYCKDCEKEFRTLPDAFAFLGCNKPYTGNEIGCVFPDDPDKIQKITYSHDISHGMSTKVDIIHTPDGATVEYLREKWGFIEKGQRYVWKIDHEQWAAIVHRLYYEYKIHELDPERLVPWKSECSRWRIVVFFCNDEIQARGNQNIYPPHWKEVKALFENLPETTRQ